MPFAQGLRNYVSLSAACGNSRDRFRTGPEAVCSGGVINFGFIVFFHFTFINIHVP